VAKLSPVCIEPMIGKEKFHVAALLPACSAGLKE
jgi:hypothetical protein